MLKNFFILFLQIVGYAAICYYFDWKLALAIFLLQWAQNIGNE